MKIGLISDTHGDLDSWNKALDLFKANNAELILHAGDILNHGVFNPIKKSYGPLDLAGALNDCPIPLIFAKGNCDSDVDTLAIEYPIQSPFAFLEKEEKRFMLLHGDKFSEDQLIGLGSKYNIDFIVRGHTHNEGFVNAGSKPLIINPGSASLPKNANNVPTIGLISDKEVSIINLNDGLIIDSLPF